MSHQLADITGDAVFGKVIDQLVVTAVGEIVVVLHADDLSDAAGVSALCPASARLAVSSAWRSRPQAA